ncbi:hypothetical protein KUL25_10275 [Rhodobacteraceae bacterium N5(2021)]|uniref:VPLPA-CTERM sorting domain-containing protein n=1 Tax=Gymnodinialimonas phycosphaerae TaxID=2841589 RepID=A0A975TYN4_9RHOB|nr:hypothetical protein [Gymnodinialimonas phycosphaerae]MBY4893150.1 hypothetical protein [Gymnodinialimonas phycosphaerae]
MNSDVWAEVGDFVRVLNLAELSATSSTASVAVNGGATSSITGIHLDDDTPSSDDEFGIRIDSGPLSFSTGDVVSWTGALEIAVDFSLFNLGTYTSSTLPFSSGRTLPMTLIVENAAPIPLPAGILLMLGGLGAVGTMGLRKSRADRSLA